MVKQTLCLRWATELCYHLFATFAHASDWRPQLCTSDSPACALLEGGELTSQQPVGKWNNPKRIHCWVEQKVVTHSNFCFYLRQTWQPLVEAFLHCKLAIIPQTQRDDGTACCAHRWVSKQNPRLSFLSHEIIRLRKSAVTAPRQQREPCCSRWNGCFLSKVTENKVKQKLYLWHPVL